MFKVSDIPVSHHHPRRLTAKSTDNGRAQRPVSPGAGPREGTRGRCPRTNQSEPLPIPGHPSTGDRGHLSRHSVHEGQAGPTCAPRETNDPPNAGAYLSTGALPVLCDSEAAAGPLWASGAPRRMKGTAGKKQPAYPLIPPPRAGLLLGFHSSSPEAAPSPQPHSARGLQSGGSEAPLGPGEQSTETSRGT